MKILGLPLGSLGTKCHLGVGLVAMHKIYYMGEGGGFPKVWAMVSLVNSCLPMTRPCMHSNYTLTNLLLGLYKSMLVVDACNFS